MQVRLLLMQDSLITRNAIQQVLRNDKALEQQLEHVLEQTKNIETLRGEIREVFSHFRTAVEELRRENERLRNLELRTNPATTTNSLVDLLKAADDERKRISAECEQLKARIRELEILGSPNLHTRDSLRAEADWARLKEQLQSSRTISMVSRPVSKTDLQINELVAIIRRNVLPKEYKTTLKDPSLRELLVPQSNVKLSGVNSLGM